MIPAYPMKNIVLCILLTIPGLCMGQTFEGLLHRYIVEKPTSLNLKESYEYWSKINLPATKIKAVHLHGTCEKAFNEVSLTVKINGTSKTVKLPCDDGFYNKLGKELIVPLPNIAWKDISSFELQISAPMLLRWSEVRFDTFYSPDLTGKKFAEKINALTVGAQRDLYARTRLNMDTVDERMFSLRMLASIPSFDSLVSLQKMITYEGEFLDHDHRAYAANASQLIYSQLLGIVGEDQVADLMLQMHDVHEYSRLAHDARIPTLKLFKTAAPLTYALMTTAGHLPDPGLKQILARKDVGLYVAKQKGLILNRAFSEFAESKYTLSLACEIFEKFPQEGTFSAMMKNRDQTSCLNSLFALLESKKIPVEIKPFIPELKKLISTIDYAQGNLTLGLLAFLQVKTPEVLPQVKKIAASTEVRDDIRVLAKKVIDSYAK